MRLVVDPVMFSLALTSTPFKTSLTPYDEMVLEPADFAVKETPFLAG